MKVNSQEAVAETLRQVREAMFQEDAKGPLGVDSALPPASGDIGELFLSELQLRRARMARWIQLINDEFTRQSPPVRIIPKSSHKCRRAAAPRRLTRNAALPRISRTLQ